MSSKTNFKKSRKVLSVLMALMLTLCLCFSAIPQVSAVTTADEKVDEVKNSILQVVMTYQPDKNDSIVISSGTCFLINSTTAVSCAHIFDPSINKELREMIKSTYGPDHEFDTKNIKSYQILVNGGVPVNATLRKINNKADYSIIKLDETVARPTVTLGHSDEMKITQQIYTLGFPSTVTSLQDSKTYTIDQVAITSSTVSNISTTDGVDYITHNANISNGNSGGPLVDEEGNVVGINLYKTNDDYFLAASIDQVVALLDDLDIEYTRSNGSGQKSDVTEPETQEATEQVTETKEAVISEETTGIATTVENKNGSGVANEMDITKLIIIIAIAVLVIVVIVVVILIVVNSKKKTKPAHMPTPVPGPRPTPAPMSTPPYPSAPGPRPNPTPNPTPYSTTVANNDGAGETSVLNDGAGETTVLGNQSTGYTMIRKRNNEKININKPEFIIGKERRRVDYCISDNNSISRVHAKIKVRAGRCYIADLGSTNCTYVNGAKLSPNQEVILSKGDHIKVSDEEFEFLG